MTPTPSPDYTGVFQATYVPRDKDIPFLRQYFNMLLSHQRSRLPKNHLVDPQAETRKHPYTPDPQAQRPWAGARARSRARGPLLLPRGCVASLPGCRLRLPPSYFPCALHLEARWEMSAIPHPRRRIFSSGEAVGRLEEHSWGLSECCRAARKQEGVCSRERAHVSEESGTSWPFLKDLLLTQIITVGGNTTCS